MELDIDDVKALLDIATNSMDFGSGFLDHEEVEVLRRVAARLGVDPMSVTPENFKTSYYHEVTGTRQQGIYDWNIRDPYKRKASYHEETVCDRCGKPPEAPCHQAGYAYTDPN